MQPKFLSILLIALALPVLAPAKPAPQLALSPYDAGFFSMQIPRGWQVITGGSCETFAFVVRDAAEPLRQIFCFGEVGPVYLTDEQRQLDMQYMQMGGYPVQWIEMPTVNPFTPENFLTQWQELASTNLARQFMPQCPLFSNFQVISSSAQKALIPNGSTSLIRAIFTENGKVAEGLFYASVAPVIGYTGGPGGNIGYGFMISGITAPQHEFAALQPQLMKCAESFTLTSSYVQQCLAQQQQKWGAVFKAGQTLRETSDIITKGWESRNRTDDVIAEKRSDAILGRERLYNPDTGEVYEFENGFYDQYDLHRGQYDMSNLHLLEGNDYNLWTTPPLDGPRNLH